MDDLRPGTLVRYCPHGDQPRDWRIGVFVDYKDFSPYDGATITYAWVLLGGGVRTWRSSSLEVIDGV